MDVYRLRARLSNGHIVSVFVEAESEKSAEPLLLKKIKRIFQHETIEEKKITKVNDITTE